MQDTALIEAHRGSTFDSLVVLENNKIMRCAVGNPAAPTYLIGSKTHKVKFPIHINTQLFLHGTPLQSLDFDMPENSTLTFYNGNACGNAEFYRDVQLAIDGGVFIDSSRSEIACWMMKQMTEDYDRFRCTKEYGGRGTEKHEVVACINL
jgi:hypothetical protein